jgi:hypothetical protein
VKPPDREAKISGPAVPDSPHLKELRALPGSIMTTTGRVAALVLVLAVIR